MLALFLFFFENVEVYKFLKLPGSVWSNVIFANMIDMMIFYLKQEEKIRKKSVPTPPPPKKKIKTSTTTKKMIPYLWTTLQGTIMPCRKASFQTTVMFWPMAPKWSFSVFIEDVTNSGWCVPVLGDWGGSESFISRGQIATNWVGVVRPCRDTFQMSKGSFPP